MSLTVTLLTEDYEEIKRKLNLLECLRICGVDNWDGWNDVIKLWQLQKENAN